MRLSALLLVVVAVSLAGCGASDLPELGRVSGVVTLDGKPLQDAGVAFQGPNGRLATGVTDAGGNYSLVLLNDTMGAVVGTNQVHITTAKPGDDAVPGSAVKETLPARYNTKTTLTRDVKAGGNTFNFDLESE